MGVATGNANGPITVPEGKQVKVRSRLAPIGCGHIGKGLANVFQNAKGSTPTGTVIAPAAGKTTTPGVNFAKKTDLPQGGTGVPPHARADCPEKVIMRRARKP
jgi:hypothetical protein